VLHLRLAVLVVVLALCACAVPLGAGSSIATAPSSELPVPAGAQEATVVSGVDGDTVVLRGRGVGPLPAEPTKVRLLLVDTPEVHGTRECFGAEASERTAALLRDGAQVRVEADRDERDRYGRVLLHVWTESGVHVGSELLRGGHATVLHLEPNDLHLDTLQAIEAEARAAGRGLWSACR
jgi:micrococcal nuclease